MTRSARLARALAIVGTATAGLLLAHELDYRLIVPDPQHRHDLLLRTGHGYWSRALAFGLVAGVLALVGTMVLSAARARRGSATTVPPTRAVIASLALVQSGGFVVLEAAERSIVGAPPGDRLAMVTLVGVAVQVLAATAGALLLRLFERAGAAVGRALAHRVPPLRARSVRRSRARIRVMRSRAADGRTARGPPSFARP